MKKLKVGVMASALSVAGFAAGTTAEASTHKVEAGDTVYKLSKEYDTTIENIVNENHLANPNLIYIGTTLEISNPNTNEVTNNTKPVESQPQQNKSVMESKSEGWTNYEFTHYTANCTGCTGVTSTGINVKGSPFYQGMRVVAVNPNVIPYGTVLELKYPNGHIEKAYAGDTGGAIRARTNLIDVLVSSESEAMQKGRVNGQIRILN
ncbi:LysM peptidoglycan-binding domain-containing protein [Priestia aryabhattai]|uniref:LysM peptidoglycan-binding domain-containing protein n=1 Tax=Priestia aryabhattai TaxID=412384 RepID=UPI002881B8BA|nr:LysM peptidoglycan-binding domain-containing protein [Priestia aryabhattai]MDT0150023.1 LysM peptidoglycan-binding domain-containing protein [Priestia aryabhattai]MDT0155593.1 LysM peptidoglycan-binding domain-containing protein [Priestia aryabhattai]